MLETNEPMTSASNARAELARISEVCRGRAGIAAKHLETGLSIGLNEDEFFPLESTIKVAIALKVLDRVKQGELALTDMIKVNFVEFNSGGPLADEFPHPGVALSVLNLLEIMMTRSCNTATDVMFRVAGGVNAVAEYVARLGIRDFEVSITMREALCIMHELPLPAPNISERDALKGQPFEVLDARNRTRGDGADYGNGKRDQAKPSSMLRLLEMIWCSDPIGHDIKTTLLDIMSRTTTSPDRVRGRLPAGVSYANKTGSGQGAASDVGFLTLPNGRGTVALAIYVKSSPIDMASRNRVIADTARLIYDYFLILTPR